MHRNRLLNLLAANRRRGEFRAEADQAGNVIYLYDSIVSSEADAEWWGGVSAEKFVQVLRGMSGDVSLRINCPGGDVFAARAMAQAIREYPGQVTAFVDGYAASAASFITSVAARVVMAEGSFLMIHKAWTIGMGNADDFAATAQLLAKIDTSIAATYETAAKRRGVGCTAEEFATLMAAETWLTGQEAIDHGLADELAAEGPQADARWDLSAYVNAPVVAVVRPRADLSPDMGARQARLYDCIEGVAEELGQFDQGSGENGAHYMADNPFAGQGIKCANCAFYDGPRGCEAVAGDIDPEAVCKLWIIPEQLIASDSPPPPDPAVANQIEQEAARRKRVAALRLRTPA